MREEELERMQELYLQGKSFKAIGHQLGRHWQTVRKYVLKAVQDREGQEVRREALRSALVQHFQDLAEALESMKGILAGGGTPELWKGGISWPPPGEERRTRLLLQALREGHARESPLWGWWENWARLGGLHVSATSRLQERIHREIEALCHSQGVSMEARGLSSFLFHEALSHTRDLGGHDLEALEVRQDQSREQLWLSQSTLLAQGEGAEEARKKVVDLVVGMKEWTEAQALATIDRQLVELKGRMEEEIEVLSLRRAFPGRCRLCPV